MAHPPLVEVLQPAQEVVHDGGVRRHPPRVRHDLVQHHHAVRHHLVGSSRLICWIEIDSIGIDTSVGARERACSLAP